MDLGDPLELFEGFDEGDRDEVGVNDTRLCYTDFTMILINDLYYLESKVRDCVISPDRAKVDSLSMRSI